MKHIVDIMVKIQNKLGIARIYSFLIKCYSQYYTIIAKYLGAY